MEVVVKWRWGNHLEVEMVVLVKQCGGGGVVGVIEAVAQRTNKREEKRSEVPKKRGMEQLEE